MHKNEVIGFKKQSSKGSNSITSENDVYYTFGLYGINWGEYPTPDSDIKALYRNSRKPVELKRTGYRINKAISAIVTNLAVLKFLFGDPTTTDLGGGLYKHIYSLKTSIDYFTLRYASYEAGGQISNHNIDCIVNAHTLSFDNENKTGYLTHVIGIDALSAIDAPYTAEHKPGDIDTDYYADSNLTSLVYDSSDITELLRAISITVIPSIERIGNKSQAHDSGYVKGAFDFGGSLSLYRKENNSVFDDFITDIADNSISSKSLVFKIYSSSSKYIQVSMSGVNVVRATMKHEEDSISFVFLCTDIEYTEVNEISDMSVY